MYAIGGNPEAAKVSGVNVAKKENSEPKIKFNFGLLSRSLNNSEKN